MPHNDEESDIELEVPIQKLVHASVAYCRVPPKKIPRPTVRNDVTWVLSYAGQDIQNYSTYLSHRGIHRKGPIRLQLGSNYRTLPKPYYSLPLRININSISRLLR